MKYFTFFIGLMMLAFAAAAQTTETSHRPPVRTSDPVAIPARVTPVVPIKPGGGKITPRAVVNVPLRTSDGGSAGTTSGVAAPGVKQSATGTTGGH